MPFGLTNALSRFQALMNAIFKTLLRRLVLVFFMTLWCILLHLRHLRKVFQIMRQHQLFAKHSKCSFGTNQVEYFGHMITKGIVLMDHTKVECVANFPMPTCIKELRGFLGFSGYYKFFIRNYGILARPLTNLLKKKSWFWDDQATKAFHKLKEALCTTPVLILLNFNLELFVDTNASSFVRELSSSKEDNWWPFSAKV
ncbi:Retrovirus-related Pol polyprotein from transposon 17.6 [Gossypium australe]|uniref:Retrovirus-related Pol polyprotein from transposon 17.6 n=1 Tax=Gossypium australe TaxID=47621 RepID=A0A5B6WHZ9_9ROSI|nr:Retrovirus-related Pol polyprotein from transposon 17.6 [Gossypium australe]